MKTRLGLLALLGAGALGCSQTTELLSPNSTGPDASPSDIAPSADAPGEAPVDVAMEAPFDTPVDAPDETPDAPVDAGMDAPGPEVVSQCPGTGSIHLGGTDDASCAGAVASRFGRFALCTCGTLTIMSSQGNPANLGNLSIQIPTGGDPGAVGAEGQMLIFGATTTAGTLVGSGTMSLGLAGGTIAGNLHSGGTIGTLASISVMGDVFSAASGTSPSATGPYVVAGPYVIGGTLHVLPGTQVDPAISYQRLAREAVTVAPPCGCAAGPLFDIGTAVSDRQAVNDNAALPNIDDFAAEIDTSRSYDISCGQYYLTGIHTGLQAAIELRIHGHVGIFVDGDVALSGNLVVTPDADAELDLVIAGALTVRGTMLGASSGAARTRVWTAASNTISLGDQFQLGALLYAPAAAVTAGIGLSINGSLFARTLTAGDVKISYDPAAATGGLTCGIAPPPVVE